ncbi:MAG TPA: type II toxin-antitoxin system YoeB family toxin [Rickettsia endosymbiont of Bembidion nr. Transversale]|nr:type II toxin-antitoxin system YoeB family toxin [Rickettsia endosymbiont of Stiretrus anchorago]HJD65741.1 type II toxin-antitoxin system YoeB family toxin [Rickettsia endosymbiont of Bembidion nr. Transversale]
MTYTILYTKKAIEDIQNLKAAKLADKASSLCKSLSINSMPSNSKKLYRDLKGKHSIRINLQHRLVYEIFEKEKKIKIISMWGHYE